MVVPTAHFSHPSSLVVPTRALRRFLVDRAHARFSRHAALGSLSGARVRAYVLDARPRALPFFTRASPQTSFRQESISVCHLDEGKGERRNRERGRVLETSVVMLYDTFQ